MANGRRAPDPDRLLVARISGIVKRHAHWRKPTESEIAAEVVELCEVAGDRPDLLAEEAGMLIGASVGELDEPRSRAAAQLCIAAGADESLIPKWIEEGRGRAEAAVQRPSPAYAAALVATPARGKRAVYTAAFSSSLITSAAVESSSSKIFTYRVVVVRSPWPSRCRTRCRSTPWSISHDACVCRTW